MGVDVGLGAKANIETKISTEIPAQSSGRFLDTLTDIIRPFSERRGLKADRIRLQREDVLILIAEKALKRAKIDNASLSPLPNKFLIPFLEKASLEEKDSELVDRWADLLVSSSIDPSMAHPRFVQILSELSGAEARMLRNIALNGRRSINRRAALDYLEMAANGAMPPKALQTIWNLSEEKEDSAAVAAHKLQRTICRAVGIPGFCVTHIMMLSLKNREVVSHEVPDLAVSPAKSSDKDQKRSLDILSSLSLLRESQAEISDERFLYVRVDYVALTALGSRFLNLCDRDLQGTFR